LTYAKTVLEKSMSDLR